MLNDTLTMYINGAIRSRCYYENKKCEAILKCRILLLDGGWTTKSPADGNKSLSLPKSICSQEVVSSCLGKDLSAWRRSPNSGTDYSGRDHITVKYCFWITRLVKKHSYSVSELPDGLFCSHSQRTTTR